MQTDSRGAGTLAAVLNDNHELLAVGILGRDSRIGNRIESLLGRRRPSAPQASPKSLGATALVLATLTGAGAFAPHWIAFAEQSPTFEVASIKTNTTCGQDRQTEKFSPGRLTVTCIKLSNLMQAAYSRFADGRNHTGPQLQIEGAPEWTRSARFDISVTARGDAPMEEMFGPMLKALLVQRFHLQTHRETRQLPVYALTAVKSGAKLKTWKEGDCIPVDLQHSNDPSPNFCGMTARVDGLHITDEARGMTMTEIAERMLANRLDRPVIDKTGIAGRFDARLEFDRDGVESSGVSIFTAAQEQLGLKLEPLKGSVAVLVVDHVEKPDAN
jgi:uncharacterized protein (TIGR03435 family)